MAAEKYDPSRINRFVIDLASAFHRFYGSCRIQGADSAVQQARLALCIGVKNVIFNVLTMSRSLCRRRCKTPDRWPEHKQTETALRETCILRLQPFL